MCAQAVAFFRKLGFFRYQKHSTHPAELLDVVSGLGARDHGCKGGPLFFREHRGFQSSNMPSSWDGMRGPMQVLHPLSLWKSWNTTAP